MQKALLRIIDANYNRAKEAIRVAEDIVRFHLGDFKLTAQLNGSGMTSLRPSLLSKSLIVI